MANSLLKKQLQESEALKQFFGWWLRELKSLVPAGIRRLMAGEKPRLVLVMEDEVCRLLLPQNGGSRLLGVCNLFDDSDERLEELRNTSLSNLSGRSSVVVRLPSSAVLTREVLLPLATEGRLDAVLQFELDRMTPFRTGQAGYGYQVLSRYPEQDKVRICLAMVRQDYLDTINNQLKKLGLIVSGVLPPESVIKKSCGVHARTVVEESTWNFLPVAMRPKEEPLWSKTNRKLLAIVVLTLVAVLAVPYFRLNQALGSLQEETERIESHATAVGAKMSRLLRQTDIGAELMSRKNNEIAKLNVIRDFTQLIGNETWITRLNIDGPIVTMRGESNQASALIELLEQFPAFQNVSFESPVTRNTTTNKERFEIRLELAGSGGEHE